MYMYISDLIFTLPLIKRLPSIACHSTILYRKSVKFGIPEELLLILLDTELY